MSAAPILEAVRIPKWVKSLNSFCHWVCTSEFPQSWQIAYLNGEIWIDMSPERILSHNQVKTPITAALYTLVQESGLGRFLGDRVLLRNSRANLSTEPDGIFVSTAARKSKRVRIVKDSSGMDVLRGAPDMVLEVLSESSRKKDLIDLRERYWTAGIQEYWIVDALSETLHFDILRRGPKGYKAAIKREGWVKSAVFGKEFRLTSKLDELEEPVYTLESR
jgi:Uma2 family endonuclease